MVERGLFVSSVARVSYHIMPLRAATEISAAELGYGTYLRMIPLRGWSLRLRRRAERVLEGVEKSGGGFRKKTHFNAITWPPWLSDRIKFEAT